MHRRTARVPTLRVACHADSVAQRRADAARRRRADLHAQRGGPAPDLDPACPPDCSWYCARASRSTRTPPSAADRSRAARARERITTVRPGWSVPSSHRTGRGARQLPAVALTERTRATRAAIRRGYCGSSRATTPTAATVPVLRTRVTVSIGLAEHDSARRDRVRDDEIGRRAAGLRGNEIWPRRSGRARRRAPSAARGRGPGAAPAWARGSARRGVGVGFGVGRRASGRRRRWRAASGTRRRYRDASRGRRRAVGDRHRVRRRRRTCRRVRRFATVYATRPDLADRRATPAGDATGRR